MTYLTHSNAAQERGKETVRRFNMLEAPIRCAHVRMAGARHGVRALHVQHATTRSQSVLGRRSVVVAPPVLELWSQLLLPIGLAQDYYNLLPILHRRLERAW